MKTFNCNYLSSHMKYNRCYWISQKYIAFLTTISSFPTWWDFIFETSSSFGKNVQNGDRCATSWINRRRGEGEGGLDIRLTCETRLWPNLGFWLQPSTPTAVFTHNRLPTEIQHSRERQGRRWIGTFHLTLKINLKVAFSKSLCPWSVHRIDLATTVTFFVLERSI